MATALSDTATVLDAIELGWSMAELRARRWIAHWGRLPSAARAAADDRPANFPPLGRERSPAELAIQAQQVVCGLAATLNLDLDRARLSYQGDGVGKASDELGRLIHELELGSADAWSQFSQFLYAWDARIQDELAAGSFTESAGYLLGRGLGEIGWGPTMASSAASQEIAANWESFLGEDRREDLLRYLDRLSTYFHPLTLPAVRCSLESWGDVAGDATWTSQPDTADELSVQASLWRDLLLGQRDPQSLIATTWSLDKARSGWKVFVLFWPQVLTAAIGIVLLSGAAWILADPKSSVSHGLGAVLGVLGFFGITGASLHARAKNTAQQLLAKIRLTYEVDLVAEAATLGPAKQFIRRDEHRRRAPPPFRHRKLLSGQTSKAHQTHPATISDSTPSVQIHQSGGRNGNDPNDSSTASGIRTAESQSASR